MQLYIYICIEREREGGGTNATLVNQENFDVIKDYVISACVCM